MSDESLQAFIDGSEDLSTGWKQRLTSLLPSVDPERILAGMRADGATWFQPDFGLAGVFPEESDLLLGDLAAEETQDQSEELADSEDIDNPDSEEDSDD